MPCRTSRRICSLRLGSESPREDYCGTGSLTHANRWWLNIACAYRDGIVGNEVEKPTKGQYGMSALPLLTGREEVQEGNRVRYIREGNLPDMHNSLITQTGNQIRILRGYRLKSIYAPAAGVRYDGL